MVLVGPSGCGKTTLLRMIAGLEEVTERARSRIGDEDVTDSPPRERDIAMVFQNYALYPHMTVAQEHRRSALQAAQDPEGGDRAQRVDEAAALLGLERAPRPQARRSSRADSASASRWAGRSCASRRRS